MNDLLKGPKLKVERANKHIQEGSALIESFLKSKPYEFFLQDDLVNRKKLHKLRATKQPPTEVAIICGEVLYLLRSALDHLVTAAGTRGEHCLIERTGFPIEETRGKFKRAIEKQQIEKRIPKLASAIQELRPYKDGNPLLWWLHWLNGAEKHKSIVLLVGSQEVREVQFQGGNPQSLSVHLGWQRLDQEPTLISHRIEEKADCLVKISANIVFADIDPTFTKRHTVTDTLQQMADLVSGVVDTFERRFF